MSESRASTWLVTGPGGVVTGLLGLDRDHPAVARGYRFLLQEQEEDGSWFGRWGVNHIYGTAAVLPALEAIGEDMASSHVRRAVHWIMEHQNADGGWGESVASYDDPAWIGRGDSTASQSAMFESFIFDSGSPARQSAPQHCDARS